MKRKSKALLVLILISGSAWFSLLFLHLRINNFLHQEEENIEKIATTQKKSQPLAECSDSQSSEIARFLAISKFRWPPPVTAETGCPEATWLEQYYLNRQPENKDFLGINVGCNKGNDAVDMGRMLSRNTVFDRAVWNRQLGDSVHPPGCGPKKVSSGEQFPLMGNETTRRGYIHCIEPVPATVSLLRNVSKDTKLDMHGLVISQAALSSQTGSVLFPNPRTGVESASLDKCQTNPAGCTSVPMFTLDDYTAQNVEDKSIDIDILLIDAEGFDFDILQSGNRTLGRVRYLEFEVHAKGSWLKQRIMDAVYFLAELDFSCYWAGKGRLWRITGCTQEPGLEESYERSKHWSNIACVRNDQIELRDIMERIFAGTLARRTPNINCGCPKTCNNDVLNEKRHRFPDTCLARIRFLMNRHALSHNESCTAASPADSSGWCGPECNPSLCDS